MYCFDLCMMLIGLAHFWSPLVTMNIGYTHFPLFFGVIIISMEMGVHVSDGLDSDLCSIFHACSNGISFSMFHGQLVISHQCIGMGYIYPLISHFWPFLLDLFMDMHVCDK